MSITKYLKIFAAMAVIALIGLAVGSGIIQSAAAQSPKDGLHPPFAFHKASSVGAADVGFPYNGSTIIFTETFGSSFAPTTTLNLPGTMWRVVTNTNAANYYWGAVTSGGFQPSAWPAGAQIIPTVPYPQNLDTWLIYGPLDLSHYASAQLFFDYYLDTTPGACSPSYSGDCLAWAYSTDGQTFFGSDTSGHLSTAISGTGWLSGSLVLDNHQFASSPIYIAFAFKSGTSPNGAGAFIRNVQLIGNPMKYVYLPLILNNYTPPPPPPLFGYFFDDAGADLAHWGGAFYNPGTTKYGQCVSAQCAVTVHAPIPHGNPGDSLRLYTNGLYRFVATSPNDITPDSFDLYMDISPVVLYPRDASCVLYGCPANDLGDWYGIIFNASGATFGSNPSQFAYNKQYYILFFYDIDATTPIGVKLQRCDGSSDPASNSCHTLGNSTLPSNFIGNSAGFDTIHITRDSSDGTIKVKVDGTTLINVQDNTYMGSSYGKYGAFIFSWDKNDTGPLTGAQMQVDFDNIKVYSR
jgi:hypothetical protein